MLKGEINIDDQFAWRADNGKTALVEITGQTERDGNQVWLVRMVGDFESEPALVDEKTLRFRCSRPQTASEVISEMANEADHSFEESRVEYDRPRSVKSSARR